MTKNSALIEYIKKFLEAKPLLIAALVIGVVIGLFFHNKISIIEKLTGVKIRNLSYKKLTDSSIRVSFETSKPVSAKVMYGTSELYGVETSESAVSTDHTLVVSGLLPEKEHNFKVVMTDEKGKEVSSENYVLGE